MPPGRLASSEAQHRRDDGAKADKQMRGSRSVHVGKLHARPGLVAYLST